VDTAFLVAVAICLGFITVLVAMRLGAAGQPNRRIALMAAELWVAVALWTGILWRLRAVSGVPDSADGAEPVRGIAARLGALPPEERLLAGVGIIVSIVLVGHLMSSLRRLSPFPPGG
jgi:hypothetical protein